MIWRIVWRRILSLLFLGFICPIEIVVSIIIDLLCPRI
jgi:hypothetical protein